MRRLTIFFLMLGLVFMFLGCGSGGGDEWTPAEGSYRVSGAGHHYPENNPDKMGNLGLNVTTSQWGWLRYYYPNMNLISTSITGVFVEVSDYGYCATITGEGTVVGYPNYTFTVIIVDYNRDLFIRDLMGIKIYNPDGSLLFNAEIKEILMRGNFDISAL